MPLAPSLLAARGSVAAEFVSHDGRIRCHNDSGMNATASRLIRRTHMYLALFLTPWMLIYALSGLVLNHFQAVAAFYGGTVGHFEKVGERAYQGGFPADATPRMIGAQILEDLGLSGAFNVQGNASGPKLTIARTAAFAQYRITYFRDENRLLIERQSFTPPVFVNRSHFRHGYEQPFLSARVWGFIVDLAIVGMLFWVLSGLVMWWEIKPARFAGGAFALAGIAMFGVLLFTI